MHPPSNAQQKHSHMFTKRYMHKDIHTSINCDIPKLENHTPRPVTRRGDKYMVNVHTVDNVHQG